MIATLPPESRGADARPTASTAGERDTSLTVGTPAHPAFTRRPVVFVAFLLVYVAWVGAMVVWALQLRHR